MRSFVAPWAEIAYLRNELRGVRASCSAEAKRGNRLVMRIAKLDRALEKRRAQARHDQAYIDALEARLASTAITSARAEIAERMAAVGGDRG